MAAEQPEPTDAEVRDWLVEQAGGIATARAGMVAARRDAALRAEFDAFPWGTVLDDGPGGYAKATLVRGEWIEPGGAVYATRDVRASYVFGEIRKQVAS